MMTLKLLALLAAPAFCMPLSPSLLPRSVAVGNGHHDGYFYSFWTDGGGEVTYQNHARGSYSVTWKNCSNFFGGKGWNPGKVDRKIAFSAPTFEAGSNGYLSVYGTAKKPMVEYYIVENYGVYDPANQFREVQVGKDGGRIEVDGGVYVIGMVRDVLLSGTGSAEVRTRVFSVRRREDRRTEGTVDMKKHFDAWREKLGVQVGTLEFQIVATEGYRSSGEAEVIVGE